MPRDCPPLQMPVTRRRSPGSPQRLSDLATNWRFPRPLPPWVNEFAGAAPRTQGNTFPSLLQDRVKDADKQPDEERRRTRAGRAPCFRASVPWSLGYVTLPPRGCAHQAGSSLNPVLWGLVWRPLHGGVSVIYSQPLAPFSSPENGQGVDQASRKSWLAHSCDQPLPRSHPGVRSSERRCSRCSYHLGNYKGFRGSVPRIVGQRPFCSPTLKLQNTAVHMASQVC